MVIRDMSNLVFEVEKKEFAIVLFSERS